MSDKDYVTCVEDSTFKDKPAGEVAQELCRAWRRLESKLAAAELENSWLPQAEETIKALRKANKELTVQLAVMREALHRDRTGLAGALVEVARIANSYSWVVNGRGPYEYGDPEYQKETGRMIDGIRKGCKASLSESGKIATDTLALTGQDALAAIEKKVWLEAGKEARRRSGSAYVDGCRASEVSECLGEAAKLANGDFGRKELSAHRKVENMMGGHQWLADYAEWCEAKAAEAGK